MDKQLLRKSLKQLRLELTDQTRSEYSASIVTTLNNKIDWSRVKYLHVYEPIKELGEVDIMGFYDGIKATYPEIRIYTSKKIADKWRITSIGGESLEELPQFDVIIVPMLGFDARLHRIGYGGGYYDRLLENQLNANKIGVCFEVGKVDELPIDNHDIPLNSIITEKSVYTNS